MYIEMLPKELWGAIYKELTIVMKARQKVEQKKKWVVKKKQAEQDATKTEFRRKYRKM